jgi:hypothetical protein
MVCAYGWPARRARGSNSVQGVYVMISLFSFYEMYLKENATSSRPSGHIPDDEPSGGLEIETERRSYL